MTNEVKAHNLQPSEWKVGDLVVGKGDTSLILSTTGYYVEINGVVDNYLFLQLRDDDLIRRVLYTGLAYTFTSVEQAEHDFKEGLFTPYFNMLEQREQELAARPIYDLLTEPTYRYVVKYDHEYAVIKRLPQSGWKITQYDNLEKAREEDETVKYLTALVTNVDTQKLYISLEFLNHLSHLEIDLSHLKFVALM